MDFIDRGFAQFHIVYDPSNDSLSYLTPKHWEERYQYSIKKNEHGVVALFMHKSIFMWDNSLMRWDESMIHGSNNKCRESIIVQFLKIMILHDLYFDDWLRFRLCAFVRKTWYMADVWNVYWP